MASMRARIPCVYVLATAYYGTLYTGVTSNLVGRMIQHREGRFDGYTKEHGIKRLVYYEVADTIEAVIRREKQLKRYRREWKRLTVGVERPCDRAGGGGAERGRGLSGRSRSVTPVLCRGPALGRRCGKRHRG